MELSSGVAAQIAQSRYNFSLDAVKQHAEAEKQVDDLLQSSLSSVPGSPIRGTNVNISA